MQGGCGGDGNHCKTFADYVNFGSFNTSVEQNHIFTCD